MAAASQRSLCSSEEKVLFACAIGRKLVSVCSSTELSRTAGYVQYRFGASGQTPELVHPATPVHPASKFSFGYEGAVKSSLVNLHFTRSGYSYTVYQQSAAFDTNGSGIAVKTPDGRSSRLRCREDSQPDDLYLLKDLGVRILPAEALVSVESFGTWSAESPSTDLLQGVRTHDFALVAWALDHGADVNFHSPYDVGVLGALVDNRYEALRLHRAVEFDEETDRLVALLLARGASPAISMHNGNTPVDVLAGRAPNRTVRRLLDSGWPDDHDYRLYIGARLGDPVLVREALDHGGDPRKSSERNPLAAAIGRAMDRSYGGAEAEQETALAALEELLKAGARMDEGTPTSAGDLGRVYADAGDRGNIRPLFDLLVRYATPTARQNCLDWLRLVPPADQPERRANLAWFIERLEQ